MDWPKVKLGEVAEISSGGNAPQEEDKFGSEGHNFVRAGSLENLADEDTYNNLERITSEVAEQYRLKLYPKGTIIFAKSGMSATKNRVRCLMKSCYLVNHLAAILPNKSLDSRFLLYWFASNPPSRMIIDEGYPSIRLSDIKNLRVELPPLEEQRRIAAILDKADEVERETAKIQEMRDEIIQATFLDMFGDPVTNPKGWDIVKVQDVCENLFAGGDVPKGNFSKEKTSDYNIPIYSNGSAEKALYGYTNINKVTEDSVTISARGTIGYPVIRAAPFYPIIRLIVAIPDTKKVNAQYLRNSISFLNFEKGGTSIPQLTVPMIKNRRILTPPIELQNQFADIVQQITSMDLSALETQATTLKAALSQELLS